MCLDRCEFKQQLGLLTETYLQPNILLTMWSITKPLFIHLSTCTVIDPSPKGNMSSLVFNMINNKWGLTRTLKILILHKKTLKALKQYHIYILFNHPFKGTEGLSLSWISTDRVITMWELQRDLNDPSVAMETKGILPLAHTVDGFLQAWSPPREHIFVSMIGGAESL